MYYYQLEKGSKKFHCPKCEKPRVFKRYVDPKGDYVGDEFGRCDREQKCSYHAIPNKPVGQNFEQIPKPVPKEVKYIPRNEVIKSLDGYNGKNELFDFLCGYFNEDDVVKTFQSYCVGSHRAFPKATVFWYINDQKQITRGKIMAYDTEGHRVKKPYPQISSAHKELGLLDYEQDKCLFGTHLIPRNPNKKICIVESEKSAIVASLYCPEYLWLACGSASQLNDRWLKGLVNRQVLLFPDRGQELNWSSKVDLLQKQTGCTMKVSYLQRNLQIACKRDGDDIADLILESIKPTVIVEPKSEKSVIVENEKSDKKEVSPELKIMIKKNPNLQTLINKLGLEETQRTSV